MSRPILPESAYEALGLDSETIKILMKPKPAEDEEYVAPNLLQSDEDSAQPMEPNETLITLYAELLLHVRTVTMFASLRTHHTRETTAKLSSDGTNITVTHEGCAATIHMPFAVQGGGDAEMTLPSEPHSKDITLRLQLEELEDSDVLGTLQSEDRKANVVPWDGASLQEQSGIQVRCAGCKGEIVPSGSITQWRDLPNENWAEMMDFWHCHKPDEHHLHDHVHESAIEGKGYAAGNRLKASNGLGFVDLTCFLLTAQDCQGAESVIQDSTQERFVVCKQCNSTLGMPDDSSDGWRIWKWNIDIYSQTQQPSETPIYSTQKWITARLLHLIENTGLRKFHIHPTPVSPASQADSDLSSEADASPATQSLLVWVFTPDLIFSSSMPSPGRHDPTRAMKVFYKQQTWQPLKPGEPESASIEDVEFPEELFHELSTALTSSQRVLPPTARKFQGWEVGLLERFDLRDVLKCQEKDQDKGQEHGQERDQENGEDKDQENVQENGTAQGQENGHESEGDLADVESDAISLD